MDVIKTAIDGVSSLSLRSCEDAKHALLKDFDSPFSIDMDLFLEFSGI